VAGSFVPRSGRGRRRHPQTHERGTVDRDPGFGPRPEEEFADGLKIVVDDMTVAYETLSGDPVGTA
jgi:hypothetical protein